MSARGGRKGPISRKVPIFSTTPGLPTAIARLKQIAANPGDHSIPSNPPHPDAELLELCAKVLDAGADADAISREARKMERPFMFNPAFAAEMKKRKGVQNARRQPLIQLGKIPAKTAAGVYAKALVYRATHAENCRDGVVPSLVRDLINCPGLRSALWPAERV